MLRASSMVSCRYVRMEVVVEASNTFLIRIKVFFIASLSSSQKLLPCFISGKIDLHYALFLNKESACCTKAWCSLAQPSTCKCPQLGWKQPMAAGQGCLAGMAVLLCWPLERLHGGATCTGYCLGFGLQDREALGWESVLLAKLLISWVESWLWAVHIRGQAVLTREWGYSARWLLYTTGWLLLTFLFPPLHGYFYALSWIRQKSGGEFLHHRGPEQSLTSLDKPAWFLYAYTWMTHL